MVVARPWMSQIDDAWPTLCIPRPLVWMEHFANWGSTFVHSPISIEDCISIRIVARLGYGLAIPNTHRAIAKLQAHGFSEDQAIGIAEAFEALYGAEAEDNVAWGQVGVRGSEGLGFPKNQIKI